MIRSITIENFKGIRDAVTIPIRPITLLFGKNSAGKSTILQAMHYLREVCENRRPDPDRTQIGGDVIDLGGFQSLVHCNELDRMIRIRAEFDVDDDGLPNTGIVSPSGTGLEDWVLSEIERLSRRKNRGGPFTIEKELPQDLFDTINTIASRRTQKWQHDAFGVDLGALAPIGGAWVEVVCASDMKYGAYVHEYAVGLMGDEFIRLRQDPGQRPCIVGLNFDHLLVGELSRARATDDDQFAFRNQLWSLYEPDDGPGVPQVFSKPITLSEQESLIPDHDQPFKVDEEFGDGVDSDADVRFAFWSMVGQALTGPLSLLLEELRAIRYIGAIRDIPPRTHRSPKTPDESRWARGLGAWDALVRDPDLVARASRYTQDVLKLGYSLRREERISLDAEGEVMAELRLLASQYEERDAGYLRKRILDPLEHLPRHPMIQIHDEQQDIDVDPCDIGVGISQVLPVVVGALDAGTEKRPCRILAVEQPELHVHPAVQVALGDLFIEAIKESERTMLIETHSEHLLLRLLRRVREAVDGSPAAADLSVVYVKPTSDGVELTPLPVTRDGDFEEPWPEGFFDERDSELF